MIDWRIWSSLHKQGCLSLSGAAYLSMHRYTGKMAWSTFMLHPPWPLTLPSSPLPSPHLFPFLCSLQFNSAQFRSFQSTLFVSSPAFLPPLCSSCLPVVLFYCHLSSPSLHSSPPFCSPLFNSLPYKSFQFNSFHPLLLLPLLSPLFLFYCSALLSYFLFPPLSGDPFRLLPHM